MNKWSHFLDANIIIRGLTPFEESKEYYDYIHISGTTKTTSSRVFNEAIGYFNFTRRAMLRFIEHAYINSARFRPSIWEQSLLIEANKLFEDDRDLKAIRLLLQFRNQEMYDVVFGDVSKKEGLQNDVFTIVSRALSQLAVVCANTPEAKIKRFDKCPKNYDGTELEPVYRKVNAITGYEKDSLILMDACHLKQLMNNQNKKKNELLFVTNDNEHILSNRTELEKILENILIRSFDQIRSG